MSCRVLIVEDDARLRSAFAEAVCAASDMELVGVAGDVRVGLRLLEDNAPDVLLVDLGLPSGSGIGLIQWASEHLPDCACVVVTVLADEDSVVRCIESGAVGYILKDSSMANIAQQIRLVREGGSPISPRIARQLLERVGARPGQAARGNTAPVMLSPQEQQVLRLSAKGYSYVEIADMMQLSHSTVETYVKRVYRKLQVKSKGQALLEARTLGLLRG